MDRQPCPPLVMVVGALFMMIMLVPIAALGQSRRATVVAVEGATQTWHVLDKDGREVEVELPSQSPIDIETGKAAQRRSSGTSAQKARKVMATVVAIDTITNHVKMQTRKGQIISDSRKSLNLSVMLPPPTRGQAPAGIQCLGCMPYTRMNSALGVAPILQSMTWPPRHLDRSSPYDAPLAHRAWTRSRRRSIWESSTRCTSSLAAARVFLTLAVQEHERHDYATI